MKKIFGLILLAVALLITPQKVQAQEAINTFHVDMTAQKNGDMYVKEQIQYDFGSQDRHGIYRFIPLVSQVGDLYRVTNILIDNVYQDGKRAKYQPHRTLS